MRATAWNNGQHHASGAGYGLKLTADDRDRYFNMEWTSIELEVPGQGTPTVTLSESFWRRCSELRSAAIGRWLREIGSAPWPKGQPPALIVESRGGDVFHVDARGRRTEDG